MNKMGLVNQNGNGFACCIIRCRYVYNYSVIIFCLHHNSNECALIHLLRVRILNGIGKYQANVLNCTCLSKFRK